jgi:hypothetical protein
MSRKVALNPKELMAAETSAVNLTFKNLEVAAASNTFDDNESENDESGNGSGDDSGDGNDKSESDSGEQGPDKVCSPTVPTCPTASLRRTLLYGAPAGCRERRLAISRK